MVAVFSFFSVILPVFHAVILMVLRNPELPVLPRHGPACSPPLLVEMGAEQGALCSRVHGPPARSSECAHCTYTPLQYAVHTLTQGLCCCPREPPGWQEAW